MTVQQRLKEKLKSLRRRLRIFRPNKIANLLYPYVNVSPLWEPRFLRSDPKLRLALVIPWYGKDLGGGAETAAWDYATAIQELRPDVEIHVLTTALKSFSSDWNDNVYEEGQRNEGGVQVHRFQALPKSRHKFHPLNGSRLMTGGVESLWKSGQRVSPLTKEEEAFYINNMIDSPRLLRFIRKYRDLYDWFIFTPYMFGTTVMGGAAAGDRACFIPCLHNERYAFMEIYQRMFDRSVACFFNVPAEMRLAQKLYLYPAEKSFLGGVIVKHDEPRGDGARFRQKYGLTDPYVMYAGKKIVGKGLPTLVDYFLHAKFAASDDARVRPLKLVIVGTGDLDYTALHSSGVIDLGFLPRQDMYDAMAGAMFFCQPSLMESFSIVIMEAWLQGTPCLVPEACEVTADHVRACRGGFIYSDADSFKQVVKQGASLTETERAQMGKVGAQYVVEHYGRQQVVDRIVGHALALKAKARGVHN